jgi:UbiD family decarboxylase
MSFTSLGEFIEAARVRGDVKDIHGAGLDVEVGCLSELSAEMDGPLLLFDRFKGLREDFRLATNVYRHSRRRYALALDIPPDAHPIELVQHLRRLRARQVPVKPKEVPDGPVLEHRIVGDEVDIRKFPAPRWHSQDGGYYIGTGDLVVIRDPETGWVNFGTYRACIQAGNRLSLWIIKHKRGRIIAEKYWDEGMPCPVAIVLGCDPLTLMASTTRLKYEQAGALHGAPVEVVKAPLTGVPVPAEAEILVEGEIPSPEEETVLEGPFGEWPGYYSHSGQECVVRIKQIAHRQSPIVLGHQPLRPMLSFGSDLPDSAARAWDHMERAGITDITGIWGHCHGLMLVIALKQRYPGHAKQALITANGIAAAGSMFGYFVAVDDDIDPSNIKEVLWAMCTRTNPATSIDLLHSAWTSDLDPRLTPAQKQSGDLTMGRVLIDACKPFHWKDSFPAANVFSPPEKEAVRKKWATLVEEISSWGVAPRR